MTREEAISILRCLNDRNAKCLEQVRRYPCPSRLLLTIQAIDLAIESLQTEQQTEEEMLREQCQAFIDIVNHTEKGEHNAID